MNSNKMTIPFHRPYIGEDEIEAVTACMKNGWLTMGERTFEFERAFSSYLGGGLGSVAVNSCTAALHLALICAGVGPGDEVILPALTFVSTAEVVKYCGAVPVLADVNPETHLVDPADIEKKITDRTKVIIPVHYSGQPCDMDEIMSIARRNGLFVIEDAAHAFPASYRGLPVGRHGDAVCFSFYATKTITTGEGGMVVTARQDWLERMKRLRLHGITADAWKRYSNDGSWRYDVSETGYKYNTTDIASSIGIEQLKKAGTMLAERERIASVYGRELSDLEGIIPYIIGADRMSAHHLYPLRLDFDLLNIELDEAVRLLGEEGIKTSVHFIPLYRFSAYAGGDNEPENFPGCEWVFRRNISLPLYAGLTSEQLEYVCEKVKDMIRGLLS